MADNIKKFQNTLGNSLICKDNINTIISLLFKVSQGLGNDTIRSKAVKIFGEVFSDRSDKLLSNLKSHIGNLPVQSVNSSKDECVDCVCSLFKALLEKLPGITWRILPVDELLGSIQQLIDTDQLTDTGMLEKATDVRDLRNLNKSQQAPSAATSHARDPERTWDNGEIMGIQILPKWEEISVNKQSNQLRPNKVNSHEKYVDWLDYFDVQFRLLREDFISPLRKGISDFRSGKVGRQLRNVRLYKEVEIVKPVLTKEGLCYEVQFNPYPFQKYRWEHSSRLIFGSLLCFMPVSGSMGSKDVLFATVSSRDPKKLQEGYLQVIFGNSRVLHYTRMLGSCRQFNMVESTAYYEASQHILRSLQDASLQVFNGHEMPFTDYLISNSCEVVTSPKYLTSNGKTASYNIQFILKHEDRNCKASSAFTNVKVTNFSQWPSLDMTGLDKSQFEALKMALSQEVSVIQGPPGTGKTYIGLKIIQALLKNNHAWNPAPAVFRPPKFKLRWTPKSPILVMCLTNHALDQFLEGILKMHEGSKATLIRIGGRSKSEKIQEHNINTVKRELKNIPREEFNERNNLFRKVNEKAGKCNENIDAYQKPEDFVRLPRIYRVHAIDEHHYWSLIDSVPTPEAEKLALELWLGLYDMVEHTDFEDEGDQIASPLSAGGSSEEDTTDGLLSGSEEHDYLHTIPAQESDDNMIAITEEQTRLLDDTSEYREIKFVNPSTSCRSSKLKNEPGAAVRRIFMPVKHKDYSKLKAWIMGHPEMTEREVRRCRNVQTVKFKDRPRLYRYWHTRYKSCLLLELEKECEEYNEACERASKANQKTDKYALQMADVIGITTTGAAKWQDIIRSIQPKIVIVEEAAEVLESHIVSALNAGTQHLILIGDHKQLRPTTNEYHLACKYHLDVSLFERLVQNDFPHVTLQIQHRMRPEIADLVRGHIYDSLDDDHSVQVYPKVKGVRDNLFLIKHRQPEMGSDDLSHSNKHEADYLLALCRFLLQQGYSPAQITVLVTYTGQLLLMKKLMPRDTFEGVRLATVDNFQGEENDIILLSLVRSNKEGSVGFLKIENRVCVALSRAKHGLYCIGDFEMLRKNADIWEKIVSDMERKGYVGESLTIHCERHPQQNFKAKCPGDFEQFGTCLLPCEFRLECGHACAKKCHITSHKLFVCKKKCDRKCPEGHACSLKCYQPCKCTEIVQRPLPGCGHIQEMKCYEDPCCVPCETRCAKIIPQCGHSQEMRCFKDPCTVKCLELCTKEIPGCGHSQEMECYRKPAHAKCQSKCEKTCADGHPCPHLCHRHQVCEPCKEMVTTTMPLCGHSIAKYCYQDVGDLKCKEICKKECTSGHSCKYKCYEHYTSLPHGCKPCSVEVEKQLDCGHTKSIECSEASSTVIECKMSCEKTLSCGHKCSALCGVPCETVKCLRPVEKILSCGHSVKGVLVCFDKDSFVKCMEPLKRLLPCGHKIWTECGELCDTIKCPKKVKRKLDCGHTLQVECSKDIASLECTEICGKELTCGHKCSLLCSKPCDTSRCTQIVEKSLDCGHTAKVECSSELPPAEKCVKPCKKNLACGHECPLPCGKPCSKAKCSVIVEIVTGCTHTTKAQCCKLSDHLYMSTLRCNEPCQRTLRCGHRCTAKCGEPCTTKCTVNVDTTCPQGHMLTRQCCQSLDQCTKKCKKILDCGHSCKKHCHQPCSRECRIIVKKQYPCGHEHPLPCCTRIEEHPCDIKCRAPLACGHSCRGKCSDCRLTRIHTPCEFSITQQHFCGEDIQMKCVGLRDSHVQKHVLIPSIHCAHGKVPYKCSTLYCKCGMPCKWACEHYKCTKRCQEICDRPPCNRKCPLTLECGHRCVSLCGEPCIENCPECDPESFSNFFSTQGMAGKFSTKETYTQLPCGHIFTVQDMDKHVSQRPSHDISPLQCPECSSLFSCSYRYGNPAKEALLHVEAVKEVCKSMSSTTSLSSDGRNRLSSVLRYSTSAFSQAQLEENPEIFSKPCRYIEVLRGILHGDAKDKNVLSRESGFVHFLLLKVFTLASKDMESVVAYKHILAKLTAIIHQKCQKLSYQLMYDLISEVYRLTTRAKFSACQRNPSFTVGKKQQTFSSNFDTPSDRMSKADFLQYSQLLDKDPHVRKMFEPAEELIRDLVYFQPVILNGRWEKCQHNSYYCVPVCEKGSISMKCPECVGKWPKYSPPAIKCTHSVPF